MLVVLTLSECRSNINLKIIRNYTIFDMLKNNSLQTLILIGSLIGIINSFILIIYAALSKKGIRTANLVFGMFIFVLTLIISKSILLDFFNGSTDILYSLFVRINFTDILIKLITNF